MDSIAEWVAPIATMVAAMITAANLGARVTGWGFVIFTIGSLGWTIVGLSSGQTSLVLTNVLLTIVNLVGSWRWLGRRAGYEAAARLAARISRRAGVPSLLSIFDLEGRPVRERDGTVVGEVVGAMAQARSGCIAYLVVRRSPALGSADRLVALEWAMVRPDGAGQLRLPFSSGDLDRLPTLSPGLWPVRPAQSI